MTSAGDSGDTEDTPEADRYYPIRITEYAADNMDDAHAYLTEKAGESFAAKWEEGLFAEIRKLSHQPYKHDIALLETRRLKRETRDVTYRVRRGGAAYRIFYTIAQGEGEPVSVVILHVRHGSRRSLTAKEAASIRASVDSPS